MATAQGERLKALVKHTREKASTAVVNLGSDSIVFPRIRSGCFRYDIGLGGGYPVGLVSMNTGWEGCAKSTMFFKAIGDAQKRCANCWRYVKDLEVEEVVSVAEDGEESIDYIVHGKCDCYAKKKIRKPVQRAGEVNAMYEERIARYAENSFEPVQAALIDVEQTFDKVWASKHCDVRRLLVFECALASEVSDLYVALMASGDVHIVMLDSVAMIEGDEEIEQSHEKDTRGLQARHVGKMIRRIIAQQAATRRQFGVNVTHFWVNQLIEKIGVMFGDPSMNPGGNRQKFFYSVITRWSVSDREIEVVSGFGASTVVIQAEEESKPAKGAKKDEEKKKKVDDDDDQVLIAKRLSFSITKNKSASDGVRGGVRFCVLDRGANKAGAFDEFEYLIDLAASCRLLAKDGSKWVYGAQMFSSRTAALKYIRDTPGVFDSLREDLFQRMLKSRKVGE